VRGRTVWRRSPARGGGERRGDQHDGCAEEDGRVRVRLKRQMDGRTQAGERRADPRAAPRSNRDRFQPQPSPDGAE
jgi:hypothetical protein